MENAGRVGDLLLTSLRNQLGDLATEVRGMGLMIGVELKEPCGELVLRGLEAGLVFNVTADKVIRLLPPLVMSEAEGRQVVERLVPLVKAFAGNRVAA
jgi:acetylornithine aminotransferase